MVPICCPETSVTTKLRCVTSQKSEDVICNRGGNLKSRTSINQLSHEAGFRLYVENEADVYELQPKKWTFLINIFFFVFEA